MTPGTMSKYEAQQLWGSLSVAEKDVLLQLRATKWDGFVVSKSGRDTLITRGLVTKYEGYQVLSYAGLALLAQTGHLECLTQGVIK